MALESNSYFYVQFDLASNERFGMLKTAFNALQEGKTSGFKDAEDPYWRKFFDDRALKFFWWPTSQELEDWLHRWNSTPPDKRFTDPSLETPWDFAAMVDAFSNGEYDLIELERLSDGTGRLLFAPYAYPFGGTGCMCALIECFGGVVTGETIL